MPSTICKLVLASSLACGVGCAGGARSPEIARPAPGGRLVWLAEGRMGVAHLDGSGSREWRVGRESEGLALVTAIAEGRRAVIWRPVFGTGASIDLESAALGDRFLGEGIDRSVRSVVPSPCGRHVAIARGLDPLTRGAEKGRLDIVDAATGASTPIGALRGRPSRPAGVATWAWWAPDGRLFAVIAEDAAGEDERLLALRPDEVTAPPATVASYALGTAPLAMAFHGERWACARRVAPGRGEAVVEDGGAVFLALPEGETVRDLRFAPGGSALYVTTAAFDGASSPPRRTARIVRVASGSAHVVAETGDGGLSGPVFEPDGSRILFVREGRRDSALVRANADGSDVRVIESGGVLGATLEGPALVSIGAEAPLFLYWKIAWTAGEPVNEWHAGARYHQRVDLHAYDPAVGATAPLAPLGLPAWRGPDEATEPLFSWDYFAPGGVSR